MAKLPVYVSEEAFNAHILPHLSHKLNHNKFKVSYHYVFNNILYVLKSGCSWRTLKPDNQLVTWQNIYYHYRKWANDGSFERLFASTHLTLKEDLALECLQLDGTQTLAKKGAKRCRIKGGKKLKQAIT
jgi:transposase